MKRKTLFWMILFAVLAAAAGAYLLLAGGGEAKTAAVYVNGTLYAEYDLSAAVIPYEVTIETELGHNTLRVSHGGIAVTEADCPGNDCVRQGEIRDSLIPIVCLPHKLVIEITEE